MKYDIIIGETADKEIDEILCAIAAKCPVESSLLGARTAMWKRFYVSLRQIPLTRRAAGLNDCTTRFIHYQNFQIDVWSHLRRDAW
ncbi:MAG: hypothetical protein WD873_03835 [Candidatus Hydrogenedentales bacterium]